MARRPADPTKPAYDRRHVTEPCMDCGSVRVGDPNVRMTVNEWTGPRYVRICRPCQMERRRAKLSERAAKLRHAAARLESRAWELSQAKDAHLARLSGLSKTRPTI